MSLSPEPLPDTLLGPRFRENLERLRERWTSFVVFGVALAVVGLCAMASSVVATLAVMLTFGSLLVVGGVVFLAGSAFSRDWEGFFLSMLAGVLYLMAGVLMVARPFEAAEAYTLVLAMLFLVEGLFGVVAAASGRFRHWEVVLFHGLITMLLGGMLLKGWPFTGFWVIGLFVGINLLLAGGSYIALGLRLKNLPSHPG